MAGQNQFCWECQRREWLCDGGRPFCKSCVTAGLVCPGYENHRPLTWLAPGKVTVHSTRKLARNPSSSKPTKKTPKQKTKSTTETISGTFENGNFRRDDTRKAQSLELVGRHGLTIPMDLKPHEWDVIESVRFFNSYIVPSNLTCELAPNRFTYVEIKHDSISTWGPSTQLWITSLALAHRVSLVSRAQGLEVDPRRPGPTKDLWSSLYSFTAHTLYALKEQISRTDLNNDEIIHCINSLLGAELLTSTSASWLTHIYGFITMINLRGGLRHLIDSGGMLKLTLVDFVIICVMANTTSPSNSLIAGVSDFAMADIEDLYTISLSAFFPCPPHLFMDIVRITRLREQVATGSAIEGGESIQEAIQNILTHIEGFQPGPWREAFKLPDSLECQIVGETFQAAVALYCILSLPPDENDALHRFWKLFYQTRLFTLLEEGMKIPLCRRPARWPLVVAGVAAADGTWDEKDLVEKYLNESGLWTGVGMSLLTTKAVLKKFWASGKTGWDNCFDRPYHVLC